MQPYEAEQIETDRRQCGKLVPALLLSAFLICCLLGGLQAVRWANHRRPAAEVFYEKVIGGIRPGATLTEVQQELGATKVLSRDEVPGWVTTLAASHPEIYPDGMENSDQFLQYSLANDKGSTEEWSFQFRNGKLVNHNPASYPATYAESQQTIVGLSR